MRTSYLSCLSVSKINDEDMLDKAFEQRINIFLDSINVV